MTTTTVLNVRVPEDVLKWIDASVSQGHFKSRSEAIRAYLREMVESRA